MLALVAAALLSHPQEPTITRDSYGVPMLRAATTNQAFRLMGQAVAEDRLWQLEMSRRTSLGQMAEVLGPAYVASDQATLSKQYTPDEYADMLSAVPDNIRQAWQAYVDGINDTIYKRTDSKTLPEGYAANNFEPRPWTMMDTQAVMVNLTRQFGQGGAGELRNFALVQYLKTRPTIKDHVLDAFDDLAWSNDPASIPTVAKRDDPTLRIPEIFNFTRAESEAHLASLPNTNLLELAGSIRLASMEDQKLVAEANSVAYKTGSYAVVVSPRKSATGNPLLLTAPQMGHSMPSIVHEVAIDTPDLKVAGMDVPGIPGVIIGYNPNAAWGFTSGVADLEDIFVSPLKEGTTYLHQGTEYQLKEVKFTLKVKGQPDKEVIQYRTIHGPVLLKSNGSKAVYSLRSSFWKQEVASTAALFDLYSAKSYSDFSQFAAKVPVSFNLFFATKTGDIGFRYCGLVPLRARGVDPRLPTLDTKENQWQGFVSFVNMPRADNPSTGFLANWNNKPTEWWPNGDTPVWGRAFRNQSLLDSLPEGKFALIDLEKAAWTIARRDTATTPLLHPYLEKAVATLPITDQRSLPISQLNAYDGWNLDGSIGAGLAAETLNQIRKLIFLDDFGNFTSDALFVQVLQPHVIFNALDGKTKINYLGDKSATAIVAEAIAAAKDSLTSAIGTDPSKWGYTSGSIRFKGQDPVPYINRGTYIQITEFNPFWPYARSVASPGVTESGPNATSQIPLSRNWQYKVMWGWE
ncbi:MAG: penicillin acylase family protein [Fimbriimonadaceae bacterium]